MIKKNPITLFHTEEFKFEKVKAEEGKEEIIISGNAQPLKEDSRNGVRYRPESVRKSYKTLEGVAFLNNHDTNKPLGHVESVGMSDTHMTYRANIDPEEKEYIRKAERGDISHVSVGCMVENVEWKEDEQLYECDVKEYVELSAVPVPGFSNTSANKEGAMFLAEKLGDNEVLEKLKNASEKKEADKDSDKDKDTDTDDSDNDKDSEADNTDTDDDKDKEEACDDKDKEEADSDDDKEKDAEKDEADDKSDDEKDDSETDTKDDKDKEKESKEDLNKEADGEKSSEEILKDLVSNVEELSAKFDEVNNRLAIVESNIDAMNDEESLENSKKNIKETLSPDTSEVFEDKKPATRNKENFNAKEKALFGEKTKKINEDKDVINMNELRLTNMSNN